MPSSSSSSLSSFVTPATLTAAENAEDETDSSPVCLLAKAGPSSITGDDLSSGNSINRTSIELPVSANMDSTSALDEEALPSNLDSATHVSLISAREVFASNELLWSLVFYVYTEGGALLLFSLQ